MLGARRVWDRLGTGDFDAAWTVLGPQLELLVIAAQQRAAADAVAYVPAVTRQLGLDPGQVAAAAPAAFAGVASDGRDLGSLLYQPVITARSAIARGQDPGSALKTGRQVLDMIVKTQVADAGRAAESVAIASTPAVGGYVRMLTPPSCPRCVILAGKWFRWNQGFARHPRCDCRHIPAAENIAGDLTTDPYAYFKSLDQAAQDKAFGAANAAAIRDGSDIYQVVNAGRSSAGLTTLEGVRSRRGFAAEALNGGKLPHYSRPTMTRLTPEGIYAQATDRTEALELLARHGYITGYGQAAGGAIQGPMGLGLREGFGQFGRGGDRVAARMAVDRARRTGVRNASIRATMTAAELRAFDAGYGAFRAELSPAMRATFDRVYLERRDWQAAVRATGRAFTPPTLLGRTRRRSAT